MLGADYFLFTLNDLTAAIPLHQVERALPALAVTPLPDALEAVLGVVDIAGDLAVVVDIRSRLRQPSSPITINQYFLIARTRRRLLAIPVDGLNGIRSIDDDEITPLPPLTSASGLIPGVVQTDSGLLLIHDLEGFLSAEAEDRLERSLAAL